MKKFIFLFIVLILLVILSTKYVWAEEIPSISPPPGMSYTFKDMIQIDNMQYIAGFERIIENSEANGIFIGYDTSTQSLKFIYEYDIGFDEEFLYIAILGNNCLGVVSRNTSIVPHYFTRQFESTEVLVFDQDGFFLEKESFLTDYSGYGNSGDKLFLQALNQIYFLDETLLIHSVSQNAISVDGSFDYPYRGDAWVNQQSVDELKLNYPGNYHIEIQWYQFSYEFEVIVHPNIEGVTDQLVTSFPVTINSTGELYLNDEAYMSGTEINIPGNYKINIQGERGYDKELIFKILPAWEGIEAGEITKDPVHISSNAVEMKLNDISYFGETISSPGEYELSFYGINQLITTIHFSIYPSVFGVENQEIYHQPTHISINGEARMNGVLMGREMTIQEPGDYLIEVFYEDEVIEEIFFSIVLPADESLTVQEENLVEYGYYIFLSIIVIIGLFLIIRKK